MRIIFQSCFLFIGIFSAIVTYAQPDLDTTFNATGKVVIDMDTRAGAWSIAVQPDNKIIMVSGCKLLTQGDFSFCVMRLNEDGSLDTSFGTPFNPPFNVAYPGLVVERISATGEGDALAVALQADGKIVVGGRRSFSIIDSVSLARFDPNGALDTSFGNGGIVLSNVTPESVEGLQDLAIQPDGKIVATGYSVKSVGTPQAPRDVYREFIARYLPNGSLDSSFGTDGVVMRDQTLGDASGQSVAIQPDGKILIGGGQCNRWFQFPLFNRYSVERFNPDGTLDSTWSDDGLQTVDSEDLNGFYENGVRSMAIQADGKVVAIGVLSNVVMRFNANGSLDSSFGSDGARPALLPNFNPFDVVTSSGSRITVVGRSSNWTIWGSVYSVARYMPNGSPDTAFGDNGYLAIDMSAGVNDAARAAAVDPRGRVVVAGYSSTGNTPNHFNSTGFYSAARLVAPIVPVTIAGRVTRSNGSPVSNVRVSLGQNGITIATSLTNPFGYYSFQNVLTGQSYSVSIKARGSTFPRHDIFITDDLNNLNFAESPPPSKTDHIKGPLGTLRYDDRSPP